MPLRQGVLEAERELREALKQRLVREFDAPKVQKNCGYQVRLGLTSEFDVIGCLFQIQSSFENDTGQTDGRTDTTSHRDA